MNIKNYTLLIIISTHLLACNLTSNKKEVEIKYFDATMMIPASFKNVTTKNIWKTISKTSDSKFKDELVSFLLQDSTSLLYVDSLNSYKFIIIREIPYVKIDSTAYHALIDQGHALASHFKINDSCYFYGSRMGYHNQLEFIESKHYRKYLLRNQQRFTYSFLISGNKKSIAIIYCTPEDEDPYNILNTLKQKEPVP